jgi:hypothetical protein
MLLRTEWMMVRDAENTTRKRRGPRLRLRLHLALVAIAVGGALLFAAFSPSAPPEESLADATFFTETPTTAPAQVASPESTTTTQSPVAVWQPLVPDAGNGVLVAESKPGMSSIDVWQAPSDEAAPTWQLAVPTEFGSPRFFQVLSETEDWVEVKVPVRPNGSIGWIRKSDATFSITTARIHIDVSDRRVQVFDRDQLVFETTGAVGRTQFPTPIGDWYLRDVIPWNEDSVYGPWVLALSAFSEQIDEINGGQAVIALHGTSRPDQLGSAVSLGCIRLSNDAITTVAGLVPVGSPVEIVP